MYFRKNTEVKRQRIKITRAQYRYITPFSHSSLSIWERAGPVNKVDFVAPTWDDGLSLAGDVGATTGRIRSPLCDLISRSNFF